MKTVLSGELEFYEGFGYEVYLIECDKENATVRNIFEDDKKATPITAVPNNCGTPCTFDLIHSKLCTVPLLYCDFVSQCCFASFRHPFHALNYTAMLGKLNKNYKLDKNGYKLDIPFYICNWIKMDTKWIYLIK